MMPCYRELPTKGVVFYRNISRILCHYIPIYPLQIPLPHFILFLLNTVLFHLPLPHHGWSAISHHTCYVTQVCTTPSLLIPYFFWHSYTHGWPCHFRVFLFTRSTVYTHYSFPSFIHFLIFHTPSITVTHVTALSYFISTGFTLFNLLCLIIPLTNFASIC